MDPTDEAGIVNHDPVNVSSDLNEEEGAMPPLAVDAEQPLARPEDYDADFMEEDSSVFEGYSDAAEEENNNAVGDALGGFGIGGNDNENPTSGSTLVTEADSNGHLQHGTRDDNNNERDPELGLPLADLDSDYEEEEETTEDANDDNTTREQGTVSWQRRIFYGMRFLLHVVFFPVLVITSVAIPVLIVMFCFALMFVALVVLLCVYYCCSPRRGDQAAVPFHVLIRQILEAVEDETNGLGDQGNDTPKYSREEIKNAMVRRKLVHFECADGDGNVVEDPRPTDEATREERMHQDMFPVIAELSASPTLSINNSEEADEPKEKGLKGFRRRLSSRRGKRKSAKKKVEVIDHNKSYEVRMAQQNIKFTTDPAANHSKHFLLKRTFVFSPPLGPEKIKSSASNDCDDDDDSIIATERETRNYNLAVAALEEEESSSSGFLQMLASSSSDSSSSDSSVSVADAATAQSSDVSFLSEDENDQPMDPRGETTSGNGGEISYAQHDSFHVETGSVEGTVVKTSADRLHTASSGSLATSANRPPAFEAPISNPEVAEGDLNVNLDGALDVESGLPTARDTEQQAPALLESDVGVVDEQPCATASPLKDSSAEPFEEANSIKEQKDWATPSSSLAGEENNEPVQEQATSPPALLSPPESSEGIVPEVDQGDNRLVSLSEPTSNSISVENTDSGQTQDEDIEASADVASPSSLLLHTAFVPMEETRAEITAGTSTEETKTEIDGYDGPSAVLSGSPSEETKTEIDTYEGQQEARGMEPSSVAVAPIGSTVGPESTNAIRSTDDSAPADATTAPMDTVPSTTQPESEHRGISSYCNICLLEYEVGDIVVWSRRPHGCHHAWHEDCLLDWLQRKPTCPNCRQDFFAIEDSPQPPETPRTEDNNDSNSLLDDNHAIVPDSTHSIEFGYDEGFFQA